MTFPSKADYIEGRARPEGVQSAVEPFANRPVSNLECDEGHPLVARYRYYGWYQCCVVCEPEEDEDLL